MLNVIYGKNASGKTTVLRNMYESCDKADVLTNLESNKNLCDTEYLPERVEYLNDLIDYAEVNVGDDRSLISEELSRELLSILELITKNSNNVFLDEPEYRLRRGESGLLAGIIEEFGKIIENFWVVTNSEYLYVYKEPGIRYWTTYEAEPNKFVLKEEKE